MDTRTRTAGAGPPSGWPIWSSSCVGDLANLFAQHVALAKVELRDSARTVGKGVAILAAVAPLVAGGLRLPQRRSGAGARPVDAAGRLGGADGALNILAGAAGVLVAAKAFRRPVLVDTMDELERTVVALAPEGVSDQHRGEARHDA